jgi:hypothetical protein
LLNQKNLISAALEYSFNKPGSSVFFYYDYTTKENWDGFYRFYSKEVEKNGWVLKKDRIEGDYREIDYEKGDYELHLGYNIHNQEHDFSIGVSWRAHKPFNED